MNEHDTIVLNRSIPEHGLQPGDVGVIVHVYDSGRGFEVEFMAGSNTIAVVTLGFNDIRSLKPNEILHVRDIAA